MPLGMKVDLGPGDIVLDGNPARPQGGGAQHPQFWPSLGPMSIVAKWPPTELLSYNRKINMTFEDKIKTTYKEETENSDALSNNLKSELKTSITMSSTRRRKISVSRKSSTRSTSDSSLKATPTLGLGLAKSLLTKHYLSGDWLTCGVV